MKNKIKVLELFAGIGAIRSALGEEDFTYTPVEFDNKVIEVYNTIYSTKHQTQDITTYKPEEKYDLVVAGFPCQPFSLAGKGLGFEDPRGKLFRETLRVIKETQPKWVILENVKGILQDKNKWIVEEINKELRDMGYNTHTNY